MVPSVSVGRIAARRRGGPCCHRQRPAHEAGQLSRGTNISAGVSEPCRAIEPQLAGVGRVEEGRRREGHQRRRRPAAPPPRPTGTPPSQPSSIICSLVRTQATSPYSVGRRRRHVLGRAGRDVQPAEPPLAADQRHRLHHLGPEHLDRSADVDLPVVGRDHQHGARRQHLEHVAHQPVHGAQLVVVVLAQAPAWATLSMPS